MRNGLPSSSSSVTLVRSDSGIDVVSVEGATTGSTYDWGFSSSPTFTQSDSLDQNKPWYKKCKNNIWPLDVRLAKWITWALILATLYGAMWGVFPHYMEPGCNLFGLTITVISCLVAEQLVVRIPTPRGLPPLPPLLASLLTGLALNNIPVVKDAVHIDTETSAIFREIALTIILTRAGLEIEPEAMMKVKWAVLRLAFLPCLVESTLIGILAHYLLGFPFEWSFMTGFMIAAVSPAVVIPSLILLQDAGWGVAKGVPSLVMAASGIDDVLAIAGFTVLLGIAIPTGLEDDIISMISNVLVMPSVIGEQLIIKPVDNVTYSSTNSIAMTTSSWESGSPDIGKEIGGAIVEVVIGVASGLFFGFLLVYFPPNSMKYKSFCRGSLLLGIGILFVFGSHEWGIPGSGALCALIMSFTASIQWKEEKKPLGVAWHHMWTVFQPILFGLTGSLVDVNLLDANTVGLGLAVLGVGLFGRLLMSTAVTFGLDFNLKERIFISVAWIPKGTVQILVLAVLITIITAPIGGFGISASGPHLLSANSGINSSYTNEGYSSDGLDSVGCDGSRRGSLDSSAALRRGSWEGRLSHSGLELKIKDPSLDEIKEEDENTLPVDGAVSETRRSEIIEEDSS